MAAGWAGWERRGDAARCGGTGCTPDLRWPCSRRPEPVGCPSTLSVAGGCSWLPQKRGALPPLQICNFVCFSLAGGKWTLPSPELVSSWSSARSCLPMKSLLQTSTRLYLNFPRPSLPLSSPLLTKLAREEKSDTRERKRDIFCPHPACCLVKGPQSELPRVFLGTAV